MPTLHSLTLAINAKPAQQGAGEFVTATQRVGAAALGAEAAVGRLDARMGLAGRTMQLVRSQVVQLAAGFGALVGIRAITTSIIEYERGLVGVAKTTDLAGAELDRLSNEIIAMSQRVPVVTRELLAIGQAAGQLGVRGSDNIALFVETVAKLGTASNLAGEEAATALARMLNVTGESVETVDTLASVIVRLGNNFAATEYEIARTATQVAQATNVFGTSSAEAAALGAAMASFGVRAELAGSSVGRAFRAIDAAVRAGGEELERMSQLTGVTGEQLTKTFRDNAVNGFELFLRGLGRVIAQGGDAASVLAEFGLEGEEVLKVLPTLANRVDLVTDALEAARDEVKNTTALNKEAERAFQTLGARLTIFGNTIKAAFEQFAESNGTLSETVDFASDVVRALAGLETEGNKAGEAAARVADAIRGLATATASYIALNIAGSLVGFARAAGAAVFSIRALTAALVANPFGAVAVAVSALIGLFATFKDRLITIGGTTATVGDFVLGTWDFVLEVIKAGTDVLAVAFRDLWGGFGDYALTAMNVVSIQFERFKNFIDGTITGAHIAIVALKKSLGIDPGPAANTVEEFDRQFGSVNRPSLGPLEILQSSFGEIGANAQARREAREAALEAARNSSPAGAAGIVGPPFSDGPTEESIRAFEAVNQKRKEARAEIERMFGALRTEATLIGKTNDERERARDVIELERKAREAGVEEVDKLIAAYTRELDNLQRLRKIEEVADGIADAFSDAFTEIIVNIHNAEQALANFAQQVSRILVRETIAEPVAQGLKFGLTSLTGGLFAGGSGGAIPGLGDAGKSAGAPKVVGGGGSQTIVNMRVVTPDANSFRNSTRQITGRIRKATVGIP